MIWDDLAPMLVAIVLILTAGGVAILRPIARRVSDLLEVYARERRTGVEGDMLRLRELVETMDARLRLLEERQDFTDRLLESGDGERVRRLTARSEPWEGASDAPRGPGGA